MECDSKEKERQELAKNIADAKKSEENARLEHAKVVADFQHKISSSKVSCIFCYVFLWRGGYPIYFVLFFFGTKDLENCKYGSFYRKTNKRSQFYI